MTFIKRNESNHKFSLFAKIRIGSYLSLNCQYIHTEYLNKFFQEFDTNQKNINFILEFRFPNNKYSTVDSHLFINNFLEEESQL